MSLSRWRWNALMLPLLVAVFLLLSSCGGDTASSTKSTPTQHKSVPTPTPTSTQGQQLLTKMANTLNSAKSLHGLFNLQVSSQTIQGMVNSEVWSVTPDRSRTEVHQSTLAQVPNGEITVTDGKQTWQYDPSKNVVYNGPVSSNSTPTMGFGGNGGGRDQSILNLVQSIFTHSDGTLRSSTARIDGHDAYDVHVVPQQNPSDGSVSNIDYNGEVYIDKATQLPLNVDLTIQGLGKVVLDVPQLELNQNIPASTFTFVPPAGAKMLPLQATTSSDNSGKITLVQAEKQAGYHLLSIPGDQTDYVLEGVTALGTPGAQTYSLHYMKGNQPFTINEGKPLANLPTANGQNVQLRGVTGTITGTGNEKTLSWTEKNVGIRITGSLNNDQLTSIANLLT
ncbi:MAG TPA: hypothetical protein VKX46_04805 [Ktedonobacteraceae bacterium]|nr:hypothetical protein [Ktedonobacteraceae bacterium]